jgi:hypothetical protein
MTYCKSQKYYFLLFLLAGGLSQTLLAQIGENQSSQFNRVPLSFSYSTIFEVKGAEEIKHLYPIQSIHLPPFVYSKSLPRGAVFCRMESHMNIKFNVWLKIRAGDIDMYHRMIESKN